MRTPKPSSPKRPGLIAGVLSTAVLLTALVAAQSVGDFPNYKGNNARTGRNGNPSVNGSGSTNLRWYLPTTAGTVATGIVDNTDATTASVGTWGDGDEALQYYQKRYLDTTDGLYKLTVPPYRYMGVVASSAAQDANGNYNPLVPATGTASTFNWSYTPPAGLRNYAIDVWLPTGATTVGTTKRFPQRYYAYQVLVNGSPVFTDVVDTYGAGTGWIRLGGGATSNRVVATDGQTITVKLFNTVPRDANGVLTTAPYDTSNASNPSEFLVYADAARFVPVGGYYAASPTVMTMPNGRIQVVAAYNSYGTGASGTSFEPKPQGVVSAYLYNGVPTFTTGQFNRSTLLWQFTPKASGADTITVDDAASSTTGGVFSVDQTTGSYIGQYYRSANLTADGVPTGSVDYEPDLATGNYDIYAFLPTQTNGESFGSAVRVEIAEGSSTTIFPMNQTQKGWVRIGTRQFSKRAGETLKVSITNGSTGTVTPGQKVFADAVQFVKDGDLSITSTPIQATALVRKTPSGAPEETPVVIVADERGVIHCLDAVGNGDGTTTTYWTYPSTPDAGNANWTDPNVADRIDSVNATGPRTSIAPTKFNTSSGVVQRLDFNNDGTPEDYLFIGADNGRVYCISMAGRGDFATTTAKPGSTTRMWTFPTDPVNDPVNGRSQSTLGPITGSIAYGEITVGTETQRLIFVPDSQGRMYALKAEGSQDSLTPSDRATEVVWAYPSLTSPTLGPIVSTPSVEFNKVYFGTQRDDNGVARMVALNANDGTPAWVTSAMERSEFDDFQCSPVTVAKEDLRFPINLPSDETVDYLYALNDNGYLYAINAATGNILWQSRETRTISRTTLAFTYVAALYNGITQPTPVITATTTNGRFVAYLAKTAHQFGDGSRVVMRRTNLDGSELTPSAHANGWMYMGDRSGNFYALADSSASGSEVDPDGALPIVEDNPSTNPDSRFYTNAKVRLITRSAYRALQGLSGPKPDYLTAINAAYELARTSGNAPAFEWGQTLYVLVYDFPFRLTNEDAESIAPPTVNVEISVDGKTTPPRPVPSLQFPLVGSGNPPLYNPALPFDAATNPYLDGYAVGQFTFQSGGLNALPPGAGTVNVSISTAATGTATLSEEFDLPMTTVGRPWSTTNAGQPWDGLFNIANPLALRVIYRPNGANTLYSDTIGNSTNGSDAENLVNDAPVGSSKQRLGTSAGLPGHGQSGRALVEVIDRSLMTLIRPGNTGLDNVRVELPDLRWQGGAAAVLKPFNGALFPGFEDLPSQRPNVSLDYPDISRQAVKSVKDPNGSAENPAAFRTSLRPPRTPSGGQVEEDSAASRVFQPTPMDLVVDVPRYQPPNSSAQATAGSDYVPSSTGFDLPQGYVGRVRVFVDSLENGLLDTVQAREAFRSFNLMTSVAPDERLVVTTPKVDLGSLGTGTGYSPLRPDDASNVALGINAPFSPWHLATDSGIYNLSRVYQKFNVRNEGNVNLLNVRMALRGGSSVAGALPWQISPQSSDPLAWLNGGADLWSDINNPYAPTNPNNSGVTSVILQKPRVEERVGRDLNVNPIRESNPNIGVAKYDAQGFPNTLIPVNPAVSGANPTYWPDQPRVAVSVPFGFPSGTYNVVLRVIEDSLGSAFPTLVQGSTSFSDPGMELTFRVRESRLTTRPTQNVAPMVEFLDTSSAQKNRQDQVFPWTNLQPTAMRGREGSLTMAWVSDRTARGPSNRVPGVVNTNPEWRIFFASVANETFNNGIPQTGGYPLYDLSRFTGQPARGRWMRAIGPNEGFPNQSPDVLFGGTVVPDTAKFGSPAFPVAGTVNSFDAPQATGRVTQFTFMAFVGEAQRATAAGPVTDSRIFMSRVRPFGTGNFTIDEPKSLNFDTTSLKGRPSVVVTGYQGPSVDKAVVFYGATTGGTTNLFYAPFALASGFSEPVSLSVGRGFSYVANPSASGRTYNGAGNDQFPAGSRIIDVSFEGRLRGRNANEIYLGRIALGANGYPALNGNTAWRFMSYQTRETMTAAGNGSFRSRGVLWDRGAGLVLELRDAAGNLTDLLVPGTEVVDRTTGVSVWDTRLGGKVTFDPSLGQAKFSNAVPPAGTTVVISYRPAFLRMSGEAAGAGFSGPSLMFDNRFVSTTDGWQNMPSNATMTSDRFVFTYNRVSTGAGQPARPFMQSTRFGIRLPFSLRNSDGSYVPVANISVAGTTSAYQVDYARDRIYFQSVDEDRTLTVTVAGKGSVTAPVGLVQESEQVPVPIEQSVNESNLTSFLDPYTAANAADRRPLLIWMFWTSVRAGNPDVYMQTIAPVLGPLYRP